MSAHHYFLDVAYCDSGMTLIAGMISVEGKPASQLVSERQQACPCSGEVNFDEVAGVQGSIEKVKEHFAGQSAVIDDTDSLNMEFEDWRKSLRGPKIEPLLRLGIEKQGRAKPTFNNSWNTSPYYWAPENADSCS
jgi:phosphomannomutase